MPSQPSQAQDQRVLLQLPAYLVSTLRSETGHPSYKQMVTTATITLTECMSAVVLLVLTLSVGEVRSVPALGYIHVSC